MGTTAIEIPTGGITIMGYDFNISGLTSSEAGYTMFTSPVGGSGDVLWSNFKIEVTGTSSKVLAIIGDTGTEAFEIERVNFNNCTSLGTISTYRQGLETGTGRFGGKPELTLDGTWIGGWFIDTSIVRDLTDGSYSLYKAGATFSMASRFRSNQNIDLNATVSFFDFAPANFVNPSTIQITGALVSRNGVFNPSDATIIPNTSASDLVSEWIDNIGINNTFVGGKLNITTEALTTISTSGVFVDLAGTYTVSDLQHFDSPAPGQLRNLGNSPIEYEVSSQFVLESSANDEVDLKVVIFRDATTSFEDGEIMRRVINSLQGGRNVAYFDITSRIILNQNDFIKFQVANVNATSNITAELNSFYTVGKR